jgi:hypothetical protein
MTAGKKEGGIIGVPVGDGVRPAPEEVAAAAGVDTEDDAYKFDLPPIKAPGSRIEYDTGAILPPLTDEERRGLALEYAAAAAAIAELPDGCYWVTSRGKPNGTPQIVELSSGPDGRHWYEIGWDIPTPLGEFTVVPGTSRLEPPK